MKATAYGTRAFWANRTSPVLPVREIRFALPLVLLSLMLLAFFFTMVHLQVQKSHYGQLIQRQTERVEASRADVRALNGRLATITALPSIRQQALEQGMVEPKRPPHDLLVRLTESEVGRMGGAEARDVVELFIRRWDGELSQITGGEGRP
jgi:hypothetical protein